MPHEWRAAQGWDHAIFTLPQAWHTVGPHEALCPAWAVGALCTCVPATWTTVPSLGASVWDAGGKDGGPRQSLREDPRATFLCPAPLLEPRVLGQERGAAPREDMQRILSSSDHWGVTFHSRGLGGGRSCSQLVGSGSRVFTARLATAGLVESEVGGRRPLGRPPGHCTPFLGSHQSCPETAGGLESLLRSRPLPALSPSPAVSALRVFKADEDAGTPKVTPEGPSPPPPGEPEAPPRSAGSWRETWRVPRGRTAASVACPPTLCVMWGAGWTTPRSRAPCVKPACVCGPRGNLGAPPRAS